MTNDEISANARTLHVLNQIKFGVISASFKTPFSPLLSSQVWFGHFAWHVGRSKLKKIDSLYFDICFSSISHLSKMWSFIHSFSLFHKNGVTSYKNYIIRQVKNSIYKVKRNKLYKYYKHSDHLCRQFNLSNPHQVYRSYKLSKDSF